MVNRKTNKGFFIKLIQRGIEMWIINRCNSIKDLKIDFDTNTMQIIKGKLNRILLSAKNIDFNRLVFQEIDLKTSEISFKIELNKGIFSFKKDFLIDANIKVTDKQLMQILSSDKWSYIRILLEEKILNSTKLKDIRIYNNLLEMKSYNKEENSKTTKYININACSGSIIISDSNNSNQLEIPIEDLVKIETICLNQNKLELKIKAKVLAK